MSNSDTDKYSTHDSAGNQYGKLTPKQPDNTDFELDPNTEITKESKQVFLPDVEQPTDKAPELPDLDEILTQVIAQARKQVRDYRKGVEPRTNENIIISAKQLIQAREDMARLEEIDGFDDVLVGNAQNQSLNVRNRIWKRREILQGRLTKGDTK